MHIPFKESFQGAPGYSGIHTIDISAVLPWRVWACSRKRIVHKESQLA